MAEIPIERKPRRSTGPLLFILILILIAVACWYWWTNYGNRKTANPATTTVTRVIQLASTSVTPAYISSTRRA